VDCGVTHTSPADGVCCGSSDDLQGAGNRDYCAVVTQGVSKRNPCWPGWQPAGVHGQCVYACHRALESIGIADFVLTVHRQTLPILKYRLMDCIKLLWYQA